MIKNKVLVVSNKIVQKNSKIDWPDLNYPGTGQTILRTIHAIDYDSLSLQLDGPDGPWFAARTKSIPNLPEGVAFYSKV